jgi:Fic family protein
VTVEMERLTGWINRNLEGIHPGVVGAMAHYNMVRIHPFDDGNGRGARLLMNLILIRRGFSPAVIRMEDRRRYIECLKKADQGDLNPFVMFVISSLKHTQADILTELLRG